MSKRGSGLGFGSGITSGILTGLGLGALLMYLGDPGSGARRRGLIRGGVIHFRRKLLQFIDATIRDTRNRAIGVGARARSVFGSQSVDDDILVERVRSRMGRFVSHPRAIDVSASGGVITLSGPILQVELRDLLKAVRSVRGVKGIENRLDVHESPSGIPSLQHGVTRTGMRPDFLQENWSPSTRALASLCGVALFGSGIGRGGMLGSSMSACGLALLARGISNKDLKRLAGIGKSPEAVTVEKTIHIDASIEDVFRYWSNYEYFPYFMRNVREVTDIGDGRSHWSVCGPAGSIVEWDAEMTSCIENQAIAWRSLPGAAVSNAGIIQFSSNPDGSTRVQIRLSYCPPAGALGHAAAWLFGRDPKHEMDEDLARMKTFIETGHAPHDASLPSYERVRTILQS